MKFASRSAIESDSSAKAGSRTSIGSSDAPSPLADELPLKDVRELGRRGVVGREGGKEREADLFTVDSMEI